MKTLQAGYIAISSVLVIMAVVVLIGATVSLLSVNDIQLSLSNKKANESFNLVEACVEEALLRLNIDNSLPATVELPEGSCGVTSVSQTGDTWSFVVSGNFEGYAKSINIVAVRDSQVEITGWMETEI